MFSVPYLHPKSQPFTDKVYTFSVLDNRIWFRNYQVMYATNVVNVKKKVGVVYTDKVYMFSVYNSSH